METLKDGRYQLSGALGEGGMATVYRAYDNRLGVWRAIKVLHPKYSAKVKVRRRFESEARTMASLEHPNIARIYDVDVDNESLFMVMELLGGGALGDWIDRYGPMPPQMAVDVMRQVCDGVAFAHARGVVHRDLKPPNVLLDAQGNCKVTDFGIARAIGDEKSITRTGAIMGTHGYMAPEQGLDAKSVDARADVYALGATLYALLTDRPPPDLFVAFQHPEMLNGIPVPLHEVLMNCTEYMAEDRYEDAFKLGVALSSVRDQLIATPATTPALVGEVAPLPPPPTASHSPLSLPRWESSGVSSGTSETFLPEMLDGDDGRSARPTRLATLLAMFGALGAVASGLLALAVIALWWASAPKDEPEVAPSSTVVEGVAEVEPSHGGVEVAPPQPDSKPDLAAAPAPVTPAPTSRATDVMPRPVPVAVPRVVTPPSPEPEVIRVVRVSPQPVPAVVSVPVPASPAVPDDCLSVEGASSALPGAAWSIAVAMCDAGQGPVTLHMRGTDGTWEPRVLSLALGRYRGQVVLAESFLGGFDYFVTTGGGQSWRSAAQPARVDAR